MQGDARHSMVQLPPPPPFTLLQYEIRFSPERYTEESEKVSFHDFGSSPSAIQMPRISASKRLHYRIRSLQRLPHFLWVKLGDPLSKK